MPEPRVNPWIAVWGVAGVVALCSRAIVRLGGLAFEAVTGPELTSFQILLLASWVFVSLYFEGYHAFQLRFCPRVVARALYLAGHPRPMFVLLAPLFSMGFFHANRKTL